MIYFEFGKFQVVFLLALCLATCDAAVIEVTAGGEGVRYEPTYQFSDEEGTKLATLVASGTNITSSVDLVTNNVSLNDLGTRLAAAETSLNDYATRLAAKEATITSLANIVVRNFGQYSLPQNISISLAAMNAGLDAMNGLPPAICSIASVGKSIQTNYGSVGWRGFTGLTVAECLAKVGTSEGANGGTIDYAVLYTAVMTADVSARPATRPVAATVARIPSTNLRTQVTMRHGSVPFTVQRTDVLVEAAALEPGGVPISEYERLYFGGREMLMWRVGESGVS